MEREPHGGEHPEEQGLIEQARTDAQAELRRLRDLTERPDNEEALVEFARYVRRELGDSAVPAYFEPDAVSRYARPGISYDDAILLAGFEHYLRQQAEPRADDTGQEQHAVPRVYVADATSAERGIHHGLWLEANRDPAELEADITALLDSSPVPEADRWAIHAMDGFAGLDLRQIRDLAVITRVARGIAEHGTAYAAWVSIHGTDNLELLDRFADFYVGAFDSAEAWMRDMADDLDWPEQRKRILDPLFQPYVTLDYAAMAEEATGTWDVATGADGRLYVFMR